MAHDTLVFRKPQPEVFEPNKTHLPGTVSPAEEVARWQRMVEQQQMQRQTTDKQAGEKALVLAGGLFDILSDEDL